MHTTEEPVYRRLADDLLRQIRGGKVAGDGFIASEHELVRRYGVSRDTVRRASAHLIEQGFVVRYPGKGLYLRQKYTEHRQTVLLIADNLMWEPCVRLSHAAKNFAKTSGWDIHISDGHGEQETNIRLLKKLSLDPDGIDGIILMAWHTPTFFELAFEMKKTGIPIVIIDHHAMELLVPSVAADNYQGGYLAGEHLAKMNHQHVAFVGDINTSTVRLRLDGFRDALADYGIPLPRKQVANFEPHDRFSDWGAEVTQALDKLFRQGKHHPTAIFCSCDAVARVLYRFAQAKNIIVPDELSIISFDDDPLAQWLSPALTTVRQPFEEMGIRAMELLQKQIEGKGTASESIALPVELIKRKSVIKRIA